MSAPAPRIPPEQRLTPAEAAELRERLREAEETLRAIRSGEADAVVVSGPEGPQVYTLVTADHSYRTLVEEMGDAALIVSEVGVILYANRQLGTLLLLPQDQLIGRQLCELVDGSHQAMTAQLLVAGSAGPAEGEVYLVRSDGELVPVHLAVRGLSNGGVKGLAVVAADLSEQKRRERAAERERLTAAVLEFAGTPILVCDAGGRVVRANAAALSLCGEHAVGCDFEAALPVGLSFHELRARAGDQPRRVKLNTPAGEQRILLAGVRRIGNGAVEHGWWVITLADLTERERLLQLERRARRTLESLQEVTGALAAAATPEEVAGIVVGAARSCLNGAHGLVAALSRKEGRAEVLAAAGFTGATLAGLPGILRERLGGWSSGEAPAERPLRLRDTGLEQLDACVGTPLHINQHTVGLLLFSHGPGYPWSDAELALVEVLGHQCTQALDRAQLYAAEHAARAVAEQANRAKSEFLSMMSHELRTPLNSVVGYVDLLLMGIQGGLSEGQTTYAERIRASARHQLKLIEEILAYARIEAGHEQVRLAPVSLARVIEEVAELVLPEASRKTVGVRVDLPPDDELQLITDGDKVRQVLLNLAGNAAKFTAEGVITLGAGWEQPGWVRILVSDSGPGIPAERAAEIWEPFTQLESGPTRTVGGTGLGLAIVRQLTELLGGEVNLDSTVGRGSTFTVRLPSYTSVLSRTEVPGHGRVRPHAGADSPG